MAILELEQFDEFNGASKREVSGFLLEQSLEEEWQLVTADSARGMASIPREWLAQVRAKRRIESSDPIRNQQVIQGAQVFTDSEWQEIAAAVEARLVVVPFNGDMTFNGNPTLQQRFH